MAYYPSFTYCNTKLFKIEHISVLLKILLIGGLWEDSGQKQNIYDTPYDYKNVENT